ncbi:MAG: cysteine peptidase family C39 domain-containing protein [Victivallaceae bacterium]|nr:cysteine peptidase family C39 domain-containing protein [Victivallaceae bacterium]
MKKTVKICLSKLMFLTVLPALTAAAPDIAEFLDKNQAAAWETSSNDFQKDNGSTKLYRWNSTRKNSLHYAANRSGAPLYFQKWQITEADFSFGNDKLESLALNIYNKSCPTNTAFAENKNTFLKFLDELRASLNKFFRTSHSRIKVELLNSARCYSCYWNTPSAYAVLKWSYDGASQYNFLAHYITLDIYKDKKIFDATAAKKAQAGDFEALVKTNSDGDRYLEIPMVDQGKRGYCVVACAERVLKYYQVDIDQHILAQAANTSNWGTRSEDIEKSMKSVGAKCGFYVKDIVEYSPLIGTRKIINFLKKYNRFAKRAGKKEIDIRRVRGYNQLFRTMDEDILIKTRVSYDESGFKKFKSKAKDTIDSGMPVLWGVMLGMIKEPELPQRVGGHMRLIIGYNPKKGEIVYSDSWGQKHDLKKISWEKAWAMTQMAYVFIPKKR